MTTDSIERTAIGRGKRPIGGETPKQQLPVRLILKKLVQRRLAFLRNPVEHHPGRPRNLTSINIVIARHDLYPGSIAPGCVSYPVKPFCCLVVFALSPSKGDIAGHDDPAGPAGLHIPDRPMYVFNQAIPDILVNSNLSASFLAEMDIRQMYQSNAHEVSLRAPLHSQLGTCCRRNGPPLNGLHRFRVGTVSASTSRLRPTHLIGPVSNVGRSGSDHPNFLAACQRLADLFGQAVHCIAWRSLLQSCLSAEPLGAIRLFPVVPPTESKPQLHCQARSAAPPLLPAIAGTADPRRPGHGQRPATPRSAPWPQEAAPERAPGCPSPAYEPKGGTFVGHPPLTPTGTACPRYLCRPLFMTPRYARHP